MEHSGRGLGDTDAAKVRQVAALPPIQTKNPGAGGLMDRGSQAMHVREMPVEPRRRIQRQRKAVALGTTLSEPHSGFTLVPRRCRLVSKSGFAAGGEHSRVPRGSSPGFQACVSLTGVIGMRQGSPKAMRSLGASLSTGASTGGCVPSSWHTRQFRPLRPVAGLPSKWA